MTKGHRTIIALLAGAAVLLAATAAVVPMHVLQKWAGHAKIETTAMYYTRVRESDAALLRDAMRIELPASLRHQDAPRGRTPSPRVPSARIGGRLAVELEVADES